MELIGFAFFGFVVFAFVRWFVIESRLSRALDEIKRLQDQVRRLRDQLVDHSLQLSRGAREAEPVEKTERDTAPAPKPEPEPVRATPPPPPPKEKVREFVERFERGQIQPDVGESPPYIDEDFTPGRAAAPREERPPSPLETLVQRIKNLGPDDPNMSWEMAVGTYWLPRLGAVGITIGIVYLLSLALQQWGPIARVGAGYAVCAVFLVGGWRLEKRYRLYARVLYAGGLALSYFVTFATYYVPYAKLPWFDSPLPTLGMLAAVVVAWAAVAQIRRSRVVAFMVTTLGHFTIGLTTFTVESPSNLSVAGIVALSAGSAFFLVKNRWYYVAAVGLFASYLNHFFVFTQSEPSTEIFDFVVGMAVLSVYLLLFAFAELFAPEPLRRKDIPVWFRTGLVTLNSVSFLLLGTILVQAFDQTRDYQHVFRYALGAALLAIGLLYLRRRNRDPLFNVYMAKGCGVVTLGLAAHFDGNTLTASLAIETVLLLVSARRSGLLVTRVLALGVVALTVLHGWYTFTHTPHVEYGAEGFWAMVVPSALTVLALFGAGVLYERTDWSRRSPSGTRFSPSARLLLWQLDFVAEPPEAFPDAAKPVRGRLFPYVYALTGTAMFFVYTAQLVGEGHRVLALSIGALTTVLTGVAVRSNPLGLASIVIFPVAVAVGSIEIVDEVYPAVVIPSLVCVFATALLSEQRIRVAGDALNFHQTTASPYFLYIGFSWLLGLFLAHHYDGYDAVLGLSLAGAALVGAGAVLHPWALNYAALMIVLWANGFWYLESDDNPGTPMHAYFAVLAVLMLASERFNARRNVLGYSPVMIAATGLLAFRYVYLAINEDWVVSAWVAVCALFAGYGFVFRRSAAGAVAAAGAAFASIWQVNAAYNADPALAPMTWGFALASGAWVLFERTANWPEAPISDDSRTLAKALCVAAASVMLVVMLERIPHLAEFYLTIAWSLLAVGLFGLALAFGERFYRYSGLLVLGLASLRVIFYDTRELPPANKIMAWIGLGGILLALGFGYVKAFGKSGGTPAPDVAENGEAAPK